MKLAERLIGAFAARRGERPKLGRVVVPRKEDSMRDYPSAGLTPSRLAVVLREADDGSLSSAMQLYEEMEEKDAHLFAIAALNRPAYDDDGARRSTGRTGGSSSSSRRRRFLTTSTIRGCNYGQGGHHEQPMKRFRVIQFDFDTRVVTLTLSIPDHWDERVKELHHENRKGTERELVYEFGELAAVQKRQNFIDLGPKPLSILAFHNRFLEQIRVAFVMGAYYPALTGACALGERILNHLVRTLREEFRHTAQYKKVYKKESFDRWDLAIKVLEDWDVLLSDVVTEFRKLCGVRNDAIHFRPEVDENDRALALSAIKSLQAVVGNQFCGFGSQPWFMTGVPGESYIKKTWEGHPFIRKVYLPNCAAVGPRHSVEGGMPWTIRDDNAYEDRVLTDDQFCTLRRAYMGSKPSRNECHES